MIFGSIERTGAGVSLFAPGKVKSLIMSYYVIDMLSRRYVSPAGVRRASYSTHCVASLLLQRFEVE
jgi:hypothetical protein